MLSNIGILTPFLHLCNTPLGLGLDPQLPMLPIGLTHNEYLVAKLCCRNLNLSTTTLWSATLPKPKGHYSQAKIEFYMWSNKWQYKSVIIDSSMGQ